MCPIGEFKAGDQRRRLFGVEIAILFLTKQNSKRNRRIFFPDEISAGTLMEVDRILLASSTFLRRVLQRPKWLDFKAVKRGWVPPTSL